MSISRQSVSPTTAFTGTYSKVRRSGSNKIIVDDVVQIDGATAFVKPGSSNFIESSAPGGGSSFPAHSNMDKCGVYLKANEILVIEYSSDRFTDFQNAVSAFLYTGCESGNPVARFDHSANTITVTDVS
ncbi:MAG: hypothetical protein H6565_12120 [Lewinellaceae bacterium]|nr:hypothetical protein [Saprospiraceae bacterium]MCB9307333.1 hypothetical protein [Lewinellaceae bacterium]MCB9354664.1 hypothetical protein [Lewinellaceae bacterium]